MPALERVTPAQWANHALDQACQHHDRALSLQAQGRYRHALDHGWQALSLMEQAVGPDHPDFAICSASA